MFLQTSLHPQSLLGLKAISFIIYKDKTDSHIVRILILVGQDVNVKKKKINSGIKCSDKQFCQVACLTCLCLGVIALAHSD